MLKCVKDNGSFLSCIIIFFITIIKNIYYVLYQTNSHMQRSHMIFRGIFGDFHYPKKDNGKSHGNM